MAKTDSILVVDDDEAKRYALVRILQHAGFEVHEAINGEEALKAAAHSPDLIILDVRLPDMTGFDVCRALKSGAHTSLIPVLHMSATFVKPSDRVHGLDSGADGYLTDFVQPEELLATVRALLRARDAERRLRVSEQRFQMFVRNINDYAVYTCDPTGVITSWNEGVQRILGYDREQFVGQSYGLGLAKDGESSRDLDKARRDGHVEYDRWHERSDGTRFFASGTLASIYDDAKVLIGFAGIVRDVTERRRIEEDRIQLLEAERTAREQAEEANRLKDEFLATLSHELRTPLTAILGWTQLMKMESLSKDQVQEAIEVIDRNAKAQAQLIEDLLDVSRIISGKLRLEVQRVDLAGVAAAAIESVQTAAQAKQIEIETHFDPQIAAIWGDPARVQQIVWNLLSNAVKFTPNGGRIVLRLQSLPGTVEFSVQDNGEGIDPAFLPHVFERFRQADATSGRVHTGLGLGLAIVRHLAELHGGTVRAESTGPRQGATFKVRLPVSAPVVAPEESPPPQGRRFENESADNGTWTVDLSGRTLLVVDDEPDARHLLRRILEQCGATVCTASSAAEAFDAFCARQPDLILSDIAMPGDDGFVLIKKVRAHESPASASVPAIALTAFAREEDRRRAMKAGFTTHFAKPVIPSELIAVIDRLCRERTS